MSEPIKILKNPLTTEDGFINEACINELTSAINNMPETYVRLASDPEWNTKKWTTDIDILGGLASAAIGCFGECPPHLEEIVAYVKVCLRKDFFTDDIGDRFRMAEMSLCEINKALWDYLGELDYFIDWNDTKKYEWWIDLSAVLHNVCIIIRDERRRCVSFDKKQ